MHLSFASVAANLSARHNSTANTLCQLLTIKEQMNETSLNKGGNSEIQIHDLVHWNHNQMQLCIDLLKQKSALKIAELYN